MSTPEPAAANGKVPQSEAPRPEAPQSEAPQSEAPDSKAPRSEAPSVDTPAATPRKPPAAPDGPAAGQEQAGARSRRPPAVTLDTARPEGGGRAAPGGAPAPARQWPMLSVLGATAAGLLITAFGHSRVGCLFIGVALVAAAVLRRVLPSVGMLAVRSRFTDMVTYGLLGVAIILLALVTEPKPWLEIPFLTDAVRFTVR
ncbi:DUF3017 domain-containing protein [Streptomyces sp. NPDC002138]|uniref:DUF3017 domain-containing protein n=1 Tax=Streptomyces sp. NPDC002138 TaxID=3154410 RepID=UPI00331A15A0